MKKSIFISTLLVLAIFNESVAQNKNNNSSASQATGLDFDCTAPSILEMHPNSDDFPITEKKGRILISTCMDNTYYTNYQTEDRKVIIKAFLPISEQNTPVYFRTVDPDADDNSSYEINMDGGDNRDSEIGNGTLSEMTVIANAINGNFAIAETELTVTDQFAGDNYQVEASLDPTFSEGVMATTILVAWKKIYVEYDEMYAKGATMSSYLNSNPNRIVVDNSSDFSIGDEIEIFTHEVGISSIQTTVVNIPSVNELVVETPSSFPFGSGIKLVNDNTTLSASNDLIKDGFGLNTDGIDGGAFIEFIWNIDGSGVLPKFTQFNDFNITQVITNWRRSDCDDNSDPNVIKTSCKNYIYVVIANDHEVAAKYGFSETFFNNYTILFNDNFSGQSNQAAAKSETLVHEFGHQFGLDIDTHPAVHAADTTFLNHENSDQGVMTSSRNRDDGEAEFFLDCIYLIRDFLDKI